MTEKDIENLNQAFSDMLNSGLTVIQKRQLQLLASLVNTHLNNLSDVAYDLRNVKDELDMFHFAIMDVDTPIQ